MQSHFLDMEITTNLVDQQLTPFQEGLQDLNNKLSTHLEAFQFFIADTHPKIITTITKKIDSHVQNLQTNLTTAILNMNAANELVASSVAEIREKINNVTHRLDTLEI